MALAVVVAVAVGDAPACGASTRAVVSPAADAKGERGGPPPSVTLEAPRHLTVRDYKPRVILGWTYDGTLTTGFEIERAIVAGTPNPRPDQFARVGTPGREARTFRDPTSHPGMTYVYRIRAVGAGTVSPYAKEIIVKVNRSPR